MKLLFLQLMMVVNFGKYENIAGFFKLQSRILTVEIGNFYSRHSDKWSFLKPTTSISPLSCITFFFGWGAWKRIDHGKAFFNFTSQSAIVQFNFSPIPSSGFLPINVLLRCMKQEAGAQTPDDLIVHDMGIFHFPEICCIRALSVSREGAILTFVSFPP